MKLLRSCSKLTTAYTEPWRDIDLHKRATLKAHLEYRRARLAQRVPASRKVLTMNYP